MSDADRIRAEIDRTRSELSYDVDALSDKVTPSKIVDRQADKVKGAFTSAKEKVMGTVSDVRNSASDSASSAGGGVSDATHRAADKAKGNPLAVGLIAFGAGWLASSLIPVSDAEKDAAAHVKDAAQPLVQKAGDAAKDVASNLKEPAKEAANAVKETATDSANTVKDEASSAADDVKSQAQDSKNTVQNS